MEFMDLVTKRQSVRKFTQQDVPMEDLLKMVDAAKYAPSGKNVQNWHFVITKNKELFEKIGEAILEKNEAIASKMRMLDEDKANRFEKFAKNFTLFYKNAPALVLVFACDYFPSGYPEMTMIGVQNMKRRNYSGVILECKILGQPWKTSRYVVWN